MKLWAPLIPSPYSVRDEEFIAFEAPFFIRRVKGDFRFILN